MLQENTVVQDAELAELAELKAQKEAIETKMATIKAKKRIEAIATVKALVAEFNISGHEAGTLKQVFTREKPLPQYYNPANHNDTWSGRGKPPAAFVGKAKSELKVIKYLHKYIPTMVFVPTAGVSTPAWVRTDSVMIFE